MLSWTDASNCHDSAVALGVTRSTIPASERALSIATGAQRVESAVHAVPNLQKRAPSPHRETGDDSLGCALGKFGAVTEFLELPLEHVTELGLLINAELVFFVEPYGARRQSFQNDVDLVLRPRIGARFRRRGKSASKIGGESVGKFLEFLGIEETQHDVLAKFQKCKVPTFDLDSGFQTNHDRALRAATPCYLAQWASATSMSISSRIATSAGATRPSTMSSSRRLISAGLNSGTAVVQQRQLNAPVTDRDFNRTTRCGRVAKGGADSPIGPRRSVPRVGQMAGWFGVHGVPRIRARTRPPTPGVERLGLGLAARPSALTWARYRELDAGASWWRWQRSRGGASADALQHATERVRGRTCRYMTPSSHRATEGPCRNPSLHLPSGDEYQPIAPLEAAELRNPGVRTDLPSYAGSWKRGENCLLGPVGAVAILRWDAKIAWRSVAAAVRHG